MTGKIPKKSPRPNVDEYGRTGLHYAAGDGDIELVRRLVGEGVDVNARDDNGWTPLHFAAQMNHFDVIEWLLSSGADPNMYDSHGNGPLWVATMQARGNFRGVKALLAAGADPAYVNVHGRSPLDLARTIDDGLVKVFEATSDQKARHT